MIGSSQAVWTAQGSVEPCGFFVGKMRDRES